MLRLSRPKRVAFSLLSAVLGFLISFVAVEAVLRGHERRLRQRSEEPLEHLPILEPNPRGTASFRLKPNLDLVTRVQNSEVEIRTNSHGMRWREVGIAKPEGRQRIAFLGDSFTFGCWSSSIDTSFVSVFERGISPRKFEVLNFGVGGYGLDDMELQLQEQVIDFSPDYVILAVFNGNDFRDTYLGAAKSKIVNGTAQFDRDVLRRKVPEALMKSDFVTSRPAPPLGALERAISSFATYRLLSPFIGTENLSLELRPSRRFTSYTFWSRYPYPEVARLAVRETLETIERIHAWLASRDIRLAVAAIPTRDQVFSDRDSGPDFDIALPQAHLRVFARQKGIPFLDLLPPLRDDARARNRRLFVERDPHFNDAGHEVSGRALADWFRCCVKAESAQEAETAPLP